MTKDSAGVFISWLPFQRRSESIANTFNLKLKYFHYDWEERHIALKAISYLFKLVHTFIYLFKHRPWLVFVQLAPTPPLYVVAFYSLLTNTKFISDCHNTMIYDGHWIKWPLAKIMLRRSALVLVHNPEVKDAAKKINIESFIYQDPPPIMKIDNTIKEVAVIDLYKDKYILLPSNMAADDEPTEEFFNAARQLPEMKFVLTGYLEKVPVHKQKLAPPNVRYTGFLKEDEFNALYKNAQMAIVLSTREGTQPSGASEAISLGVPLIVTDLKTTRKIYKDTVLFTENNANSIVEAINNVYKERDLYLQKILLTKKIIESDTNMQAFNLKNFINALSIKNIYPLLQSQ
jgi:glycosyltransferase involved in cell wall biosynthesis